MANLSLCPAANFYPIDYVREPTSQITVFRLSREMAGGFSTTSEQAYEFRTVRALLQNVRFGEQTTKEKSAWAYKQTSHELQVT